MARRDLSVIISLLTKNYFKFLVLDIREPRSAVLSYTSALLKARVVAEK